MQADAGPSAESKEAQPDGNRQLQQWITYWSAPSVQEQLQGHLRPDGLLSAGASSARYQLQRRCCQGGALLSVTRAQLTAAEPGAEQLRPAVACLATTMRSSSSCSGCSPRTFRHASPASSAGASCCALTSICCTGRQAPVHGGHQATAAGARVAHRPDRGQHTRPAGEFSGDCERRSLRYAASQRPGSEVQHDHDHGSADTAFCWHRCVLTQRLCAEPV